jgi:hypothetical protein
MKIRVYALDLNTTRLQLFYAKEGSETIEEMVILQGDERLKGVYAQCKDPIINNGYADIEIREDSDPFATYAEKTEGKGMVKFFRVLKSAVKAIFGGDDETPKGRVGQVPPKKVEQVVTVPVTADKAKSDKIDNAVADIMKHATPATSSKINSDETIIAVVGDKVVPEMEKLKDHVAHAAKTDNPEGLNNFIARLSAVIDSRKHSVQDCLTFVQKNDLPFTNAGDILAYKVLRRLNDGRFADKHTGKVFQKVGSKVFMAHSLVDLNRNASCSNGLHIARKKYIRGFFHGNDVIVLCVIRPEDILAVPHGEPDKVRVCGYQIIAEIPKDTYTDLTNNVSFPADHVITRTLAAAVAGNYPAPVQLVEITQGYGGGLVITDLDAETNAQEVIEKTTEETVESAAIVKDTDNVTLDKSQALDVKTAVAEVTAAKSMSRNGIARAMFDNEEWAKLYAFKKEKKVGWHKLGFSPSEEEIIVASKPA